MAAILIKKERSKEIISVTLSPFDKFSIATLCDERVKKPYRLCVVFLKVPSLFPGFAAAAGSGGLLRLTGPAACAAFHLAAAAPFS